MIINPYRTMWLLALFDLPVTTPKKLKEYQRFRKFLVKDGFTMMQYSVYMRFCASPENAETHMGRIKNNVPPEGEVRVIQLTSKQFERMQIYWGRMTKEPEKPASQLQFF